MPKSEVYSWRLSPELRAALDLEAKRQGVSLATLLDRMADEWLRARRASSGTDVADQARRHAAAASAVGTIAGGDPRRAERARLAVRERLVRQHDR